jgi:hypothetical protein
MKILQIIEGHINKARAGTPLSSRAIELISRWRMRHCKACKVNGKPCLKPGNKCCQCNCDMEAKTRAVNAKCPLGKW